MKSARRRALIAKNKKKEKGKSIFFKILIPFLILLILFLFIKINTKNWNGKNKVSLVYQDGENVNVTLLDPKLSEVTTFIIPGKTQVDVARNYGNFRLTNVWQLGINEKIGGSLMTETITQNFLFPVFLWSEKDPGFVKGNLKSMMGFVFFPGKTNIKLGDRLKMVFFVANANELGKTEINLEKSKFIICKKLEDGEPGCKIEGQISQRLTMYFSDNEAGNTGFKVNIIDETGAPGVSEKLGQILQVIGGKIVSIDRRPMSPNGDCTIKTKNINIAKKISNLFSCKISHEDSPFDLDIRIGKKFADRF